MMEMGQFLKNCPICAALFTGRCRQGQIRIAASHKGSEGGTRVAAGRQI